MKDPNSSLPAGGLERMRAALRLRRRPPFMPAARVTPLRARNNEFAKLDVLEQGIKEAHERNKNSF